MAFADNIMKEGFKLKFEGSEDGFKACHKQVGGLEITKDKEQSQQTSPAPQPAAVGFCLNWPSEETGSRPKVPCTQPAPAPFQHCQMRCLTNLCPVSLGLAFN